MIERIRFAKYFCYLCNMDKYFSFDMAKAKIFIRFLKKERVYLQFRKAFEDKDTVEWRAKYCSGIPDFSSFVSHAFWWSSTRHGRLYWHTIDERWQRELLKSRYC